MLNYITLKEMGSSGGLCSQLQIFSGLLAVARANNLKIAFSENMIKNHGVGIRIFDLLNLESEYEIKPDEFFLDFKNKHIYYLDKLFIRINNFFYNTKFVKICEWLVTVFTYYKGLETWRRI